MDGSGTAMGFLCGFSLSDFAHSGGPISRPFAEGAPPPRPRPFGWAWTATEAAAMTSTSGTVKASARKRVPVSIMLRTQCNSRTVIRVF